MTFDRKKLNCGEDDRFPRNLVSGLIAIAVCRYETIIFQGSNFFLFLFILLFMLYFIFSIHYESFPPNIYLLSMNLQINIMR